MKCDICGFETDDKTDFAYHYVECEAELLCK